MRLPKTPQLFGRQRISVGAGQPPHGEFDVAAGQFAPAFDPAHIGLLGIAGEEIARLGPRLVARQREGLAQVTVAGLPPPGHPVRQVARTKGHVANSSTDNDRLNIASAAINPSPPPAGRPSGASEELSRLSDMTSILSTDGRQVSF